MSGGPVIGWDGDNFATTPTPAPPPEGGGGTPPPPPPPAETGYFFPPVPTFESTESVTTFNTFRVINYYWKATTGSMSEDVLCRYKLVGTNHWFEGHPFVFDSRSSTQTNHRVPASFVNEYRGHIHLPADGGAYVVQLLVPSSGEFKEFAATCWPEVADLPTVTLTPTSAPTGLSVTGKITTLTANRSTALTAATNGTATDYVRIRLNGFTIDVNNAAANCITVPANARYVIIEGPGILRGAQRNGVEVLTTPDTPSGARMPLVIVKGVTIENFGRPGAVVPFGLNADSGVKGANSTGVYQGRIVVEDCIIRNPRYSSNSWSEYGGQSTASTPANSHHPDGPQGITIHRCLEHAQNVIRHNYIYVDASLYTSGRGENHKWNDGIGGFTNRTQYGFPGGDSYVANNRIEDCWDDAAEMDGGNPNLLVVDNIFDDVYNGISTAPVTIGPCTITGNIIVNTKYTVANPGEKGAFIKVRNNQSFHSESGFTGQCGLGRYYIYNNQAHRTGSTRVSTSSTGISIFISPGTNSSPPPYTMNSVILNNLMDTWTNPVRLATDVSVLARKNLRRSGLTLEVNSTELPKNPTGTPVYDSAHASGPYTPATTSPAYGTAEVIPNLGPDRVNTNPDIGAVQRGAPARVYGPRT